MIKDLKALYYRRQYYRCHAWRINYHSKSIMFYGDNMSKVEGEYLPKNWHIV